MQYLGAISDIQKWQNMQKPQIRKNDRVISVHFQGKTFNIIVIQVYAPTTSAEEVVVD